MREGVRAQQSASPAARLVAVAAEHAAHHTGLVVLINMLRIARSNWLGRRGAS
jgi:hypothetical protein